MAIDGMWETTTKSPMGNQIAAVTLVSAGATLTGTFHADEGDLPIYDGHVDGPNVEWKVDVTRPMKFKLHFKAVVDGDEFSGTAQPAGFPSAPFVGTREDGPPST